MASNKPKTEEKAKVEAKAEVKEEKPIDKFELAKKVIAANKEKETVKQKGIYSAMNGFQIVRN